MNFPQYELATAIEGNMLSNRQVALMAAIQLVGTDNLYKSSPKYLIPIAEQFLEFLEGE